MAGEGRMRGLALVVGLAAAMPAVAGPFSTMSWSDARKAPGVVVFDLSKAGSCSEPEGWDDPSVASWINEHGVTAVRLDRSKEPTTVRKLVDGGHEVVPMRIAYRDGVEIDRACGCVDAPSLTAWMAGLAEGRTLVDAERARLGDPLSGELDVMAELEVVKMHYCAKRHEAGVEHLILLWNEIPKRAPEYQEARFVRVGHDMAVLARKSKEAEARIVALRDGLEQAKDTDFDALDDWVALNRVLLQDDRTVAWYDAHRGEEWFSKFLAHQAPNIFFLLTERGRWADAGAMIDDPMRWLARWKAAQAGLEQAAIGYGALMAAGRSKEAAQYAKDVLKVAPEGTSCQLVARAVEAGGAHKSQAPLLKGCDAELSAAWSAALP
jgi:hypothetical protein